MPIPSGESDPSWPEALPSDGAIRSVFDQVYGYEMIGSIDDPHYRVRIVHDTLLNNYEVLTTGLYKTLTNLSDAGQSRIIGRQINQAASSDDPLINFHGLNLEKDIAERVLPRVQIMFDDLMVSGMGPQHVLDHMAAMIGILVAQSQSFSDGNTRIARALHDFIRDGRGGISADRIFDRSRDFIVPTEIEEMLLAQNVTRMINGDYENGQFYPTDSNHVPDSVRVRLARSKEFLGNILSIGREYAPIKDASVDLAESMRLGRLYHVEDRISNIVVPDEELSSAVVTTLRQREYGPAAWTVAFVNRDLVSLPLSPSNAKKLLEADRALLRLRVTSLVKGMQSGGVFYSMVNAQAPAEYESERMSWMPPAIHR